MLEQLWAWVETLKSAGAWGHILTFVGSVLTTTLFFARYIATSRAEIRRLRLETRNQYAQDLLGARLSSYKECYAHLSEFVKVALGFRDGSKEYHPVAVSELSSLNARLSDWDSAYALLLSADAGGRLFGLRACIRDLLHAGQSDTLSEKEFWQLMRHIERVEVALKTDVGVFAVDEFLAVSRPQNYTEVKPR